MRTAVALLLAAGLSGCLAPFGTDGVGTADPSDCTAVETRRWSEAARIVPVFMDAVGAMEAVAAAFGDPVADVLDPGPAAEARTRSGRTIRATVPNGTVHAVWFTLQPGPTGAPLPIDEAQGLASEAAGALGADGRLDWKQILTEPGSRSYGLWQSVHGEDVLVDHLDHVGQTRNPIVLLYEQSGELHVRVRFFFDIEEMPRPMGPDAAARWAEAAAMCRAETWMDPPPTAYEARASEGLWATSGSLAYRFQLQAVDCDARAIVFVDAWTGAHTATLFQVPRYATDTEWKSGCIERLPPGSAAVPVPP